MTRRVLHGAVVLAGIVLGLWHWELAAQGIFVFRHNEPVSSWILVSVGFLGTLPLAISAIWWPRAAGWAMVGAALLAAGAAVLDTPRNELADTLLGVAKVVSGPLLAIGSILIRLGPPLGRATTEPNENESGRRTSGCS